MDSEPVARPVPGSDPMNPANRDHGRHLLRPVPSAAAARAERFVAGLIDRMTLEEKIGQLVGVMVPSADIALEPDILTRPPGIVMVPAIPLAEAARAVARVQRELIEHTRLGIPALAVALGELGQATRFPVPLARAATWERSLVARIAAASAVECRAGGVHGQLAPSVAVAAVPTGSPLADASDTAACFGGDRLLASELVTAHVVGAQGRARDRIDDDHVAAAAVHLGAGGLQVGVPPLRGLGERAMRSWVLPPAEAAVRAGVAMVVPSHAGNGGIPSHADSWLLRTVLREEWGFTGPVVAAPGAVAALTGHHRVVEDIDAAHAMAWESGVDVTLMAIDPSGCGERIGVLVRRGTVPGWLVDDAVAAVLRLKWRLGLWERPYPPEVPDPRVGGADHPALARRAVQESLVLLSDPGEALPLGGSGLRELQIWAADEAATNAALTGSLAAAMARDLPATEVRHLDLAAVPDGTAPLVVVADTGILRAARAAGVVRAAGYHCVVLLCGGPDSTDLGELVAAQATILLCWQPTTDHAAVISRVLVGAAEPGGRLPVSLAGPGRSFPLGHGRGYTTFEYSDLRIISHLSADGPVTVTCRVANTGARAGKEVTQVYLRDHVSSVITQERRLVGFAVVRLDAGHRRQVTIRLPASRFALWDRSMRLVVEPGGFDVMVGGSADDIRLTGSVVRELPDAVPDQAPGTDRGQDSDS